MNALAKVSASFVISASAEAVNSAQLVENLQHSRMKSGDMRGNYDLNL